MKAISYNEALELLEQIGHHTTVSISVQDKHGVYEDRTVLNEAMVYDPWYGGQRGMSNNQDNAERAVSLIMRNGNNEMKVYSSYFNWATGDYRIHY